MSVQLASLDSEASFGTGELEAVFVCDHDAEKQFLADLRAGVESAYEDLIRRFEQPIYNLVSRLLTDPSEACDVVQEVFLKVFRKITAFRGESTLKTWIYRIAVNEAHNHSRWHGRHRRQEVGLQGLVESGSDYREMIPGPSVSPYDYALGHETHMLIEEALASLNPRFRAAVVLRDIEDMSYEEIAEVLNLPLGTVKSRILRGREALRTELQKRLEPVSALRWVQQTVE